MAYSDLTSSFGTKLNRDDLTSAQTQVFFTDGFARIIRETEGRLFYLERTSTFQPPSPNTLALQSATLGSGGSGYGASQTFNVILSGGTFTTAAQANVTSNASGVVTQVNSVTNPGVYTVAPSSPAATTGGGGTGLTLKPVFAPAAFNSFAVPSDLVSITDVITPDAWGVPKPLKHLPHRKLIQQNPARWPTWYSRYGGVVYVQGSIPLTQTLQLLYYGQPTALAVDGSGNYQPTATNELTTNCPDLCIYAALTFAADDFKMDQAQQWEARYQQLLAGEVDKTVNLEFEGGPLEVQPAYGNLDEYDANIYWGGP